MPLKSSGSSSSARLLALVVLALAVPLWGCATMVGAGGSGAQVRAAPLGEAERQVLDQVQGRVQALLLMELMRPVSGGVEVQRSPQLAEQLRASLAQVSQVWPSPEAQHYEVARTLGTIYATATSQGWPGASQLAELFLQRAVELEPGAWQAWEALGTLHLMTGDVPGAVAYLERARELAQVPAPSVLMALAQAYHLSGRQPEAEATLGEVVERRVGSELPRALLELVQVAAELEEPVFRTPRSLQAEPFRPRATQTALALPELDYRNLAHGFAVRVPWTWTLQDEATDRELSNNECRPMAYVAWDLPQASVRGDELSRVRVSAFPVPAGTTAEVLASARLPFVKLPAGSEALAPVRPDSVHRYWRERTARGEREGEVVFLVSGSLAFVLQYVATPEAYGSGRASFAAVVESFQVLAPGAYVPPDCLGEAPI